MLASNLLFNIIVTKNSGKVMKTVEVHVSSAMASHHKDPLLFKCSLLIGPLDQENKVFAALCSIVVPLTSGLFEFFQDFLRGL